MTAEIHLVPFGATGRHSASRTCGCFPVAYGLDRETGAVGWRHRESHPVDPPIPDEFLPAEPEPEPPPAPLDPAIGRAIRDWATRHHR